MHSQQFVAYTILLCLALYILSLMLGEGRISASEGAGMSDQYDEREDDEYEDDEEGFDPLSSGLPQKPSPPAAAETPGSVSLQSVIDFSDVTITEAQRKEWQERQDNARQIQSVNERFDAAKRKTDEYKLKPGILPTKKRRQLVESIIRRPYCGRRTRSWRTEFSDTLRGDVVPKGPSSWSMMRVGGADPAVDLHPGALGPMSGLSGQWVSDADIPDNTFDDFPEDG